MKKTEALEKARKLYNTSEKLRKDDPSAADYLLQPMEIVRSEGLAVAKAMVLVDPALKDRVLCRRKTSNINKKDQLCDHVSYEYVLDEPDNAVHIQMFGV